MVLKLCIFVSLCSLIATDAYTQIPYDQGSLSNSRVFKRFPQAKDINHEISNQPNGNAEDKASTFNIDERENTTEDIPSIIGTTTVEENQYKDAVQETVPECEPGQSSFSKNDLILLINHFAAEIKLNVTIHESYFNYAVSVRDKHAQTLKDFRTQFENKPKHLKDILEDMKQMRLEKIEPLAKGLASELQLVTNMSDNYPQKLNDAKVVLDKLEKYKQICALTCDGDEIEALRKRSIVKRYILDEEYHCSTLEELKEKITTVLTKFCDEYTESLKNQTTTIDRVWEDKINEIKIEMKDLAVKEFGPIMYEVLSLQDEYNHFFNSLKNNNVVSQVSEIKKSYLQIDFRIEELMENIEKYRSKCLNCHNQNFRIRRDNGPDDLSPFPSESDLATRPTTTTSPDSIDILEQLISTIISKIKTSFEADYIHIFEELKKQVDNKDDFIRDAIAGLGPYEEDITDDLKLEKQHFSDVKKLVPKSSLDELSNLNSNLSTLLTTLDDAVKFITDNI